MLDYVDFIVWFDFPWNLSWNIEVTSEFYQLINILAKIFLQPHTFIVDTVISYISYKSYQKFSKEAIETSESWMNNQSAPFLKVLVSEVLPVRTVKWKSALVLL